MKGFTFWRTYYDVAQELTPAQQGTLYRAICEYAFADNDLEDELKGKVRIVYKAIKPNIITSKRRSESGQVGNDVRWNANASQTHRKPIAKKSQVKDKVKDKDKGQCEIANSAVAGIPESARSALIDLGMLRGGNDAE